MLKRLFLIWSLVIAGLWLAPVVTLPIPSALPQIMQQVIVNGTAPPSGGGTLSVDGTGCASLNTSGANSETCTITVNPAATQLVIFTIEDENTNVTTSVTAGAASAIYQNSVVQASQYLCEEIWTVNSSTSGWATGTVVITAHFSGSNLGEGVAAVSILNGTGHFQNFNSNYGNSGTTASVTITSATGHLALDSAFSGKATMTKGNSSQVVQFSGLCSTAQCESSTLAGATSDAFSWTFDSTWWAEMGIDAY